MENKYAKRIEALRALMDKNGWDAIILTGSDPHSSEYPGQRWKQVEWLTGFSGECGDVVVTADHAGLWTDTRFFIQAGIQLPGTGVELHKTRVPEQVLIPEWLSKYAFPADGSGRCVTVAVDGLCQRVSAIDTLADAFKATGRQADGEGDTFSIVSAPDFMSELWEDRPAIPQTPMFNLSASYTGETRETRLARIREAIAEKGCDAMMLTALDEIAWTLNVRGNDIEYVPVTISYLLVTAEDAKWFVIKDSYDELDDESKETLKAVCAGGVSLYAYDEVADVLAQSMTDGSIKKIFVDPSTLNFYLQQVFDKNAAPGAVVCGDSPVQMMKSIKNQSEMDGMRASHVEDGIAMEKFLYWLEAAVQDSADGGKPVTEWDASLRLTAYRAECDGTRGDSFSTISAYGPGAALPHYVTPQVGAPEIEPHGLYLNDSGGHYLFGTTDITRTTPMGECTQLEKEDYTLVLRCHINLAKAVFPIGTCGPHLDILARNPLWQTHRNFGHGTGHGVGFYLGVHEGPQEFRQNFNNIVFQPGMILTNEPGLYREGMHGVRHESQMLVVEDGTSEFGTWLKFEVLTLCHIDTSAVLPELMNRDEIEWLNAYNKRVYDTLSPRLPAEVAEWLKEKCEPIGI